MNKLIQGLLILNTYTKGVEFPIECINGSIWINVSEVLSQEDENKLKALGWDEDSYMSKDGVTFVVSWGF